MRPFSILIPLALATASAFAQKPDLRAGGPSPSQIPNHEVTTVTLPGSHLAGAKVEARGACRLAGYKVVSDTEIQMRLEGARAIDDKEDGCFFTVRTAAGSDGGWLVVNLTPDEEKEKHNRQATASRTKVEAMMHAAGRKWQIRFADGASAIYTAKPSDNPGIPEFQSSDGHTATVVVQPDGTVIFIEGSCMRRGRLADGKVKNGESSPGCAHPGPWSGSVEP